MAVVAVWLVNATMVDALESDFSVFLIFRNRKYEEICSTFALN